MGIKLRKTCRHQLQCSDKSKAPRQHANTQLYSVSRKWGCLAAGLDDCISNHLRVHWTELWRSGGYQHIREPQIQSIIQVQAQSCNPQACRCVRDQCAHHLKLFSFLSWRRTLITLIEELTLRENKNTNCYERQPQAHKSFLRSSVTHSQLLMMSISTLVGLWVSSTCSPAPSCRIRNTALCSAALFSTQPFAVGPSPQDMPASMPC